MAQYNVGEAKTHFSELVKKALLGEQIVIAKNNKPVLRLLPIKQKKGTRVRGAARFSIWQTTSMQFSLFSNRIFPARLFEDQVTDQRRSRAEGYPKQNDVRRKLNSFRFSVCTLVVDFQILFDMIPVCRTPRQDRSCATRNYCVLKSPTNALPRRLRYLMPCAILPLLEFDCAIQKLQSARCKSTLQCISMVV
jgi:prevent-host-death family protein